MHDPVQIAVQLGTVFLYVLGGVIWFAFGAIGYCLGQMLTDKFSKKKLVKDETSELQ